MQPNCAPATPLPKTVFAQKALMEESMIRARFTLVPSLLTLALLPVLAAQAAPAPPQLLRALHSRTRSPSASPTTSGPSRARAALPSSHLHGERSCRSFRLARWPHHRLRRHRRRQHRRLHHSLHRRSPARITWHPGGNDVVGWSPDGKNVLFRSMQLPSMYFRLFLVHADGSGIPDPLPLPAGDDGSFFSGRPHTSPISPSRNGNWPGSTTAADRPRPSGC